MKDIKIILLVAGGILLAVFFVCCGGFLLLGVATSSGSNSTLGNSSVISDISWEELDSVYNIKSDRTDLQKDEIWKGYEGKYVDWVGEVTDISKGFGGLTLYIKMKDSTFTHDLRIELKSSEESKALKIIKGDRVNFTGRLDRWGTILAISLDNGEIPYVK